MHRGLGEEALPGAASRRRWGDAHHPARPPPAPPGPQTIPRRRWAAARRPTAPLPLPRPQPPPRADAHPIGTALPRSRTGVARNNLLARPAVGPWAAAGRTPPRAPRLRATRSCQPA
jgi:hypothetical protein